MFSLNQFKTHMFKILSLMEKTGTTMEIIHKGVVYELSIRPTDKKPKYSRPKRKKKTVIRQIDTTACDNCGSIKFNGVCMNSRCLD